MKKIVAVAMTLGLAACATPGPYQPTAEEAGPPPSDVQASLERWMQANLFDPYSAKVEYVSEPRPGAVWTGLVNQGHVPAWYVCTAINARNSFGGYTGLKRRALFFDDNDIVVVIDAPADGFHRFSC